MLCNQFKQTELCSSQVRFCTLSPQVQERYIRYSSHFWITSEHNLHLPVLYEGRQHKHQPKGVLSCTILFLCRHDRILLCFYRHSILLYYTQDSGLMKLYRSVEWCVFIVVTCLYKFKRSAKLKSYHHSVSSIISLISPSTKCVCVQCTTVRRSDCPTEL